VGKALIDILYQRNARVWIATRSEQRTLEGIAEIKKLHPKSKGEILFLSLVLDDLTTIKASVEKFLAQESRLDVVWNNAGVMHPPEGSRTAQGYELQLGVNVLGHFLFIKLLTPLLQETAKTAPVNSVRVVWVSSMSADFAPTPAIDFDNMDYHIPEGQDTIYARSKSGNLLHAAEFQRRYQDSGIVSVSMNPGLLKTNLQRNFSSTQQLLVSIMGRPAKYGAYTELFAGLDASVTAKDKWITPFGRKEKPRADLVEPELGRKYWAWSEAQVEKYL
jgi:NAD(P)-dependent dehydrogenase (short-subunit alcohol dehydrogenase family)